MSGWRLAHTGQARRWVRTVCHLPGAAGLAGPVGRSDGAGPSRGACRGGACDDRGRPCRCAALARQRHEGLRRAPEDARGGALPQAADGDRAAGRTGTRPDDGGRRAQGPMAAWRRGCESGASAWEVHAPPIPLTPPVTPPRRPGRETRRIQCKAGRGPQNHLKPGIRPGPNKDSYTTRNQNGKSGERGRRALSPAARKRAARRAEPLQDRRCGDAAGLRGRDGVRCGLRGDPRQRWRRWRRDRGAGTGPDRLPRSGAAGAPRFSQGFRQPACGNRRLGAGGDTLRLNRRRGTAGSALGRAAGKWAGSLGLAGVVFAGQAADGEADQHDLQMAA